MTKCAYSNADVNARTLECIAILHVERATAMVECAYNKR